MGLGTGGLISAPIDGASLTRESPKVSGPVAPSAAEALQIRRATEEDCPGIAEIYNDAVRTTTATFDTEPRSPDDQVNWLRGHDTRHPVLVAESRGTVVGWASLSPWSDRQAYADTVEVSVYVRPVSRGRGVARRLLTALVAGGEREGLHVLLARIADCNAVSRHLHEALGFRRVGTMHEVGYKFGRRIDVQLYELILAEPAVVRR